MVYRACILLGLNVVDYSLNLQPKHLNRRIACPFKSVLLPGVAVGSSTQIALFVVPVAVLAGWAYGRIGCMKGGGFTLLVFISAD